MPGTPYQKTIVMTLPTAVANGITTVQSGVSGTSLAINGSLATTGVATLVPARRVIVTSAGDDSNKTFTITGTDRYGRSQTEVMTGANGVATSTKDFLTVTAIVPSANTASTVTAGTSGVGSSEPFVCDALINPGNYACAVVVSGTVNYTIQETYDDLGPDFNVNANPPTWFPDTNFTSQSINKNGVLNGPFTMIRLLINSGTGTATAHIITPLIGGR